MTRARAEERNRSRAQLQLAAAGGGDGGNLVVRGDGAAAGGGMLVVRAVGGVLAGGVRAVGGVPGAMQQVPNVVGAPCLVLLRRVQFPGSRRRPRVRLGMPSTGWVVWLGGDARGAARREELGSARQGVGVGSVGGVGVGGGGGGGVGGVGGVRLQHVSRVPDGVRQRARWRSGGRAWGAAGRVPARLQARRAAAVRGVAVCMNHVAVEQ